MWGAIASAIYASRALIASQQAASEAHRQADEAVRQANAAIEANKINREAFTSVQRAFITIASFDTPVRMTQIPGTTQQIKSCGSSLISKIAVTLPLKT
jgi:hypothetical protein